jgi:hypothetical protein
MPCLNRSHHLTPLSTPGAGRVRQITALTMIGCAALAFCHVELGARALSPQDVLERFLASHAQRAPVPYRAFRRLEASSAKLNASGWVEALTEFDPQGGMRYRVLAEEGAGRIRGALKGVLDGERESTVAGQSASAALTLENYEFQPGAVDDNGLVSLTVKPRRKDTRLVDGTIFVTAEGADLVRVEGRLAKSPSFWTRSVDVVRRYEQRAGRILLVEVRSSADVKVVGQSEFVMRYEYESVNGQVTQEGPPPLLASRLERVSSGK